ACPTRTPPTGTPDPSRSLPGRKTASPAISTLSTRSPATRTATTTRSATPGTTCLSSNRAASAHSCATGSRERQPTQLRADVLGDQSVVAGQVVDVVPTHLVVARVTGRGVPVGLRDDAVGAGEDAVGVDVLRRVAGRLPAVLGADGIRQRLRRVDHAAQ